MKPDINSGFLDYGKGQEVTYLNISIDMDPAALSKDVKNDAVQFKNLEEFAKKKPSQFVVVSCNNEEEGFMAVSYLHSIYNKIERVSLNDVEDELSDEINIDFDSFDEEDLFGEGDENEWEESGKWNETPWKIPIVDLVAMVNDDAPENISFYSSIRGKNVTDKDNKMKVFLDANPGIRSRINSTIFFDSYTPEQMVEIFNCHAKIAGYRVEKGSSELIQLFFEKRVNRTDFGNGREARSLLENTILQVASRLAANIDKGISEKEMCEIKMIDIKAAIEKMQFGMEMQLGNSSGKVGFVC